MTDDLAIHVLESLIRDARLLAGDGGLAAPPRRRAAAPRLVSLCLAAATALMLG